MALEDLLSKLITSIDANTAAIKAAGGSGGSSGTASNKPAKADAKPDKGSAGKATIEFDQVKAAAGKVLDKMGKAFTKKLIKDVGGSAELATVKAEKYGALVAAFEAALDKSEDEAEEDEDEL